MVCVSGSAVDVPSGAGTGPPIAVAAHPAHPGGRRLVSGPALSVPLLPPALAHLASALLCASTGLCLPCLFLGRPPRGCRRAHASPPSNTEASRSLPRFLIFCSGEVCLLQGWAQPHRQQDLAELIRFLLDRNGLAFITCHWEARPVPGSR